MSSTTLGICGRLFIGPLTTDEIVDTLSAALASSAWASLFDVGTDDVGKEERVRAEVRGILRLRPIAVVLAELSGVARLVQYAHSELASGTVKTIVAGA